MITTKTSELIAPHGGRLVDLMVPAESFSERKAYASRLTSIQISPRTVCDLELLATGAFSPLDRFMGQEDYRHVLNEMRLNNGSIFPVPITLTVDTLSDLHLDRDIALRNSENELMAIMTIEEIYKWDQQASGKKAFEAIDSSHPIKKVIRGDGSIHISGRLQVLRLPRHYDFQDLWLTPAGTRTRLSDMAGGSVTAFQPNHSWENVKAVIARHVNNSDGKKLLLHPAVGLTRLGDMERYAQIRIYKTLVESYIDSGQVLLSLLPLVTRSKGYREIIWQALVRRNYGASQLIVDIDHSDDIEPTNGNSSNLTDSDQELIEKFADKLGVNIVLEPHGGISAITEWTVLPQQAGKRDRPYMINTGLETPPVVLEILRRTYLPRHEQGFCIWFTGLSGSGKSTTAEMLTWLLLEHERRVTVLDGDVVRNHLSKGLGFNKSDRDTNVRRIGFVASELVRLGGAVICAVVSPYRDSRNAVRDMMGREHFIEVHVDTPLEICEDRDVKGFYAKARRGELKGFTGIDDPYEPPDCPEITLDTIRHTPQENAGFILEYLIEQSFILKSKK